MTPADRAAQFFGKATDAWLAVPCHFADVPQIRGTLKHRDRCVALIEGTAELWRAGRREYDPDLWFFSPSEKWSAR